MSKSGFTHESVDNKSVDWYTPPWIFEALGISFDLDPCAPVGGVPWIPAKAHFSESDNGLIQPWHGTVWLNPPYGVYTLDWLEKMHQYRNGVALVFSRTDTKWFHEYIINADAILFMKGRVKFVDGLGVTGGNGAGSGSLLAAWGGVAVAALENMQQHGVLWKPSKQLKSTKQFELELAA